jgi:hypothetical protein
VATMSAAARDRRFGTSVTAICMFRAQERSSLPLGISCPQNYKDGFTLAGTSWTSKIGPTA